MLKIYDMIKRYGFTGLVRKAQERAVENRSYDWTEYAPTIEELEAQNLKNFTYSPKISLVIPCYNTREEDLIEVIRSVKSQSYVNWELIIIDASDSPLTALDDLHNGNIVVKHLPKNLGISENTNEGLALANGDYIGLVDHDDILCSNALFEMVNAMQELSEEERECLLLYSDEDKISADGNTFFYPHFKLDYNKELFRHYNYFCHFTMFSRGLYEKVGGMNPQRSGSQDYDLFLRMLSAGAKVVHVPKILYHWRSGESSTAGDGSKKFYAYVAGVQALEEHLHGLGLGAMASISEDFGVYNIHYEEYPGMAQMVDGLYPSTLEETASSVVLYQGSEIEQVRFSEYGYHESSGGMKQKKAKHSPDWRQVLASYLNEEDVALVCSRTTKGNSVWQCGLRNRKSDTEEGQETVYCHRGLPSFYKGYMKRASLPQDVEGFSLNSALVAKTEVLKQVGGIDVNLPSPEAEMDLSRRIREAGYRIVLVPQVEAVMKKA